MSEARRCCICGDCFKTLKCGLDSEYKGKLLCNKHYIQIQRNGKITDETRSRRRDRRVCDICKDDFEVRQNNKDGEYKGYLLCLKHYTQVRNQGFVSDEKRSHTRDERKCIACGSTTKVIFYKPESIMLCKKHYDQKYIHGEIFERTIFDRNEIRIRDTYAELILYDGNNIENGIVKIDIEDIKNVKDYKWRIDTWGYASSKIKDYDGNKRNVFIHRYLLSPQENEVVDHINRDRLDNRRSNLRIADKSINSLNCEKRRTNTSGVTGVNFWSNGNLWRAYININKKRRELGYFHHYEDAVKARLQVEYEHLGLTSPQSHLFEAYGVLEKNE
ncbi:HNH endonuclease [Paenibacillus medicaginis]|uniref:HNH endonuclease n=1 Tax=Paenibacillus medicaginis TaxID=1470560 RepID=A0ABV5BUF5_9BACL